MDGSVVVRGRGFRAARRRRAAAAVIEGDTTRPALTSSDTLHLSDKLRLALVLDLPAAPAPVVVGWAAWARVVVVGWPAMCGKRVAVSVCRAEARGELFIVCRARVPCDGWAVEVQNAAEEPGGRCICGCDGGGDGGGGSVGRLWRWWWRTVWR